MTRYYDRERNYRYAAEEALQMGLSRLAKDTSIHLADTGYVQLMTNAQLTDAYGNAIQNAKVNLYVGLTGNTTGQFGEFASLVAEVHDTTGNTRYVRRLELMAQNFARSASATRSGTPAAAPPTTTPFRPCKPSAVDRRPMSWGTSRAPRRSRSRPSRVSRHCRATPPAPTTALRPTRRARCGSSSSRST